MLTESVLTLTISCNILYYPSYEVFELKGDYSEEANRCMEQYYNKLDTFDSNDILYKVIAKELENGVHSEPEVDK
jgi:hypothetical protein